MLVPYITNEIMSDLSKKARNQIRHKKEDGFFHSDKQKLERQCPLLSCVLSHFGPQDTGAGSSTSLYVTAESQAVRVDKATDLS